MAFDGPRLRRDLLATIFEQDGVRCVDVHDPRRGSTFRLFGYEYSVALALDGRPLAKIIPWVRLSTGLELTVEQLTAFAERLDQLGFLVSPMARTPAGPRDRTPVPVRRTVEWAAVTRVPASSEPLTVWMPVPIPAQPETAEDDAPTPSPAPSRESPAPESPAPVTEPAPPDAEAAATETRLVDVEPAAEPPAGMATPLPDVEPAAEPPAGMATPSPDVEPTAEPPAGMATPSPDVEPAAEPPAETAKPSRDVEPATELPVGMATPSPDVGPAAESPAVVAISWASYGALQAQPWLLAADATPGPVETPAPELANSPVETRAAEPVSPSVVPAVEPVSPSFEAPAAEPVSPSVEAPAAELVSPSFEAPAAEPVSPSVEAPAPPASLQVQDPSAISLETLPSGVLKEEPPPIPPEARTPSPLRQLPPQGRMSAAEDADAASRRRVVQSGARVLTPGSRRTLTPPPLRTPGVAPASSRFAAGHSGPWIFYALLGTVAALAVAAVVVPLAVSPHPPAAVRARVLVVKPTAVLRWFDGTALLESLPGEVLSLPAGGKVIRLAPAGTALKAGDVVAATDVAGPALAELARQQGRLAYFEQLAEGMRDTGDEKRVGEARVRVDRGAGLVGQALAALSRVAVVAQTSGQVEATLATLGQSVRAGAPAVRLRSAGWRANFELARPLVARVRKQGFCAAEIDGQPVGCSFIPDGGDENHAVIQLAPEAATAAGRPVRLARVRLSDAFLVPASALSRVGDSDRVLVVAPTGRAEARNVVVVDRTASDAVITQGLDAGDVLIVETSQPVGAGAQVRIAGATRE